MRLSYVILWLNMISIWQLIVSFLSPWVEYAIHWRCVLVYKIYTKINGYNCIKSILDLICLRFYKYSPSKSYNLHVHAIINDARVSWNLQTISVSSKILHKVTKIIKSSLVKIRWKRIIKPKMKLNIKSI